MEGIFSILIALAVALAIPGIINRTRALFAGRKGVRFHQHILNVQVMLRKGVVIGHTSTFIFRSAPCLYLASSLVALMFIPIGSLDPLLHFNGDFVLVAYLLALGRFSLILAALDTGSSFEGMGASREALYGAMVEPALFISAGTLALISGMTSFADIFHATATQSFSPELTVLILLLGYVFIKIFTVEAGRIPVDDPRTHLELTMIHEVMILDYSGFDLALITIAGWIKNAVIALLAANTLAIVLGTGWLSVPATILMAGAVGLFIGISESFVARNKLTRNTTYIVTILAISFVLFMVAYLLKLNISIG